MKTTQSKTALILLCLNLFTNLFSQSYGEIRGIIKTPDLEPIPYATIKVLQGKTLISGAQSDINGKYSCKPINPGLYELIVIEPGHITQQINKIKVTPSEATYLDVKLNPNVLGTVTVVAKPIDYSRSGAETNVFGQVSLDAKELMENASYSRGDIEGALEAITSDVIRTPDGEVHFRGSRGDASAFFVDGVRTIKATHIPGLAIENLTVFSGGVPAMYGDVTAGVVLVTTKSYFSGLRDKNMRIIALNEKKEEEKRRKIIEEEEKKRLEEIEAEKLKLQN